VTWYARARARGLTASGEPDTRFGRRYFVRRRVVGAEGRGKSGVSRRFERRDWIVSPMGVLDSVVEVVSDGLLLLSSAVKDC
jgi:hypothetical protein